jgi:hypothetical protein
MWDGPSGRVARVPKPTTAGRPGHHHGGDGGQSLKEFDGLGVANSTIVYTIDNGAEVCIRPDGDSTPYRSEEATNREGGPRPDVRPLAECHQARRRLHRPRRFPPPTR